MLNKITIAGVGTVGNALKTYLEKRGSIPFLYDPPKGYADREVLQNVDCVFLCVPTPYSEQGFDTSYLDSVVPLIGSKTLIVIKPTVLPGTTEMYQQRYPDRLFIFNPEFLTERTAVHDFEHPSRQIIGYTAQSRTTVESLFQLLPDAPYKRAIPSSAAEMIKYMNNVFYALKVTYANHIYDLCEKMGIDYALVAEGAVSEEPMMGRNHWDVFHKGYRGYGGHCLPKDVQALIQLGTNLHVDTSLIQTMHNLNEQRKHEGKK